MVRSFDTLMTHHERFKPIVCGVKLVGLFVALNGSNFDNAAQHLGLTGESVVFARHVFAQNFIF